MKLRVLMSLEKHPDDIIGIVPFRGNVLIATRNRLLLLEHDEETEIKIKEIVQRHHDELWPDI